MGVVLLVFFQIDFHSDFVAFGDTSIIPSISLGEEREFIFREIESGNKFVTPLAHVSLPINPDYKNERINLTFRKYGFSNCTQCLKKPIIQCGVQTAIGAKRKFNTYLSTKNDCRKKLLCQHTFSPTAISFCVRNTLLRNL